MSVWNGREEWRMKRAHDVAFHVWIMISQDKHLFCLTRKEMMLLRKRTTTYSSEHPDPNSHPHKTLQTSVSFARETRQFFSSTLSSLFHFFILFCQHTCSGIRDTQQISFSCCLIRIWMQNRPYMVRWLKIFYQRTVSYEYSFQRRCHEYLTIYS